MQNNQIGLFLNWSVIGAQGASGDPRDNKWLGTSWNSSNPNTHVEGTDGGDSPFYIQSSYPYNPQYNGNGGGGDPLDIFTTSGSWGGGCIYTSGASFKTDGELDLGTEDLLSELPTGEPTTERKRSQFYMAQYNLYHKLKGDAEVTGSNAELEAFVAERDGDNMGKLHQAVTGFHSAREGGEALAAGTDLLSVVQPENLVEHTLKDVFSILYAYATDLTALDQDGETRLREIAKLCPLDYGFGVYTARAALVKLDTLPKHYVSECEMAPSPEQMSEKRGMDDESIAFNAYPNPTNAGLTVTYSLKEGETGQLNILDLSGKVILRTTLTSAQKRTELQLSGLAAGLYVLQIYVDGKLQLSERITVIRP